MNQSAVDIPHLWKLMETLTYEVYQVSQRMGLRRNPYLWVLHRRVMGMVKIIYSIQRCKWMSDDDLLTRITRVCVISYKWTEQQRFWVVFILRCIRDLSVWQCLEKEWLDGWWWWDVRFGHKSEFKNRSSLKFRLSLTGFTYFMNQV